MSSKTMIGNVVNQLWDCVGYQQITGAAAMAAPSIATGAKFCTIQAEATTVRYMEVTSPSITTGVGMVLNPGLAPQIFCGNMAALQFWCTTAAGIVNVAYYR